MKVKNYRCKTLLTEYLNGADIYIWPPFYLRVLCSEELNFLIVARRGAPEAPGSSDSKPQTFEHALLARRDGFR